MNSADKTVSLAFDAVTGRLYGNTSLGFGAPFEAVYEIDPATGVTTFIGRILFDKVDALGFDQGGNLFGVSDATNQLISISTVTGNGSLIGNLGLSLSFDIASRPEDDVMFLADSGTFSLYQLYTTTGATRSQGLRRAAWDGGPPVTDCAVGFRYISWGGTTAIRRAACPSG